MNQEILSDRNLARRLERAEGAAGARFVEVRARVAPDSGAEWTEIAGAYAMFDGVASPITQTFGLGLYSVPTLAELDRIEAFFRDRGAPVMHEVSPMADKELLPILGERGYRPVELTSVMCLPLGAPRRHAEATPISVHMVGFDEHELWARTAADGWREFTEFADLVLELSRVWVARENSPSFLAQLDGKAVGTGGLAIHEGIALLAGASTVPEWRKRGAQTALLEARLEYAVKAGCDLAMMCAEPGSSSQRNAQRQGFRIAYTRIKWGLTA